MGQFGKTREIASTLSGNSVTVEVASSRMSSFGQVCSLPQLPVSMADLMGISGGFLVNLGDRTVE